MARHETSARSRRAAVCAWCGDTEGTSWRTRRGKLYCSLDCQMAANAQTNAICASIMCVLLVYAIPFSGIYPATFFGLAFVTVIVCVYASCALSMRKDLPKGSAKPSSETPRRSVKPSLPATPISAMKRSFADDTFGATDATIVLHSEFINRHDFETAITTMVMKEDAFSLDNIMPELLLGRAKHVLRNMNLHLVIDEKDTEASQISGRIAGWARSNASGKQVAVDISVIGWSGGTRSECRFAAYSADPTEASLIAEEVRARLTRKRRAPAPATVKKEPAVKPPQQTQPEQSVSVERRSESLEDGLKFIVTVKNDSLQPVTSIKIWPISYPSSCTRLTTASESTFPKLAAGQTAEALFHFEPTADYVRGEVVAAVSYSDANRITHTIAAEPFPVRAVCGLGTPEPIDARTFERELAGLENGEITINLDNLSTEHMYNRAVAALPELRFYQVSSDLKKAEGLVMGEVNGWSRGQHTRRKLGLSIIIYGPVQGIGCSCRIVVSAEDDTIILPAIDEVRHALSI